MLLHTRMAVEEVGLVLDNLHQKHLGARRPAAKKHAKKRKVINILSRGGMNNEQIK
jgi:hypothetical protein